MFKFIRESFIVQLIFLVLIGVIIYLAAPEILEKLTGVIAQLVERLSLLK